MTLIDDVNHHRVELATNGVIVNDALRIIQSKMEHLNGNGKREGGEKRLLREIKEDFNPLQDPELEHLEEQEQKTTNGVF